VSYPAGDPNVTSVGGITTNVDLSGSITAPWLAWGISTSDNGYGGQEGSGGGTALYLPAPAWQSQLIGATEREQPDVSLNGDPSTGVSLICETASGCAGLGTPVGIGGTSVSSPEMAAMWADVLSACIQHPGAGVCPSSIANKGYRLGVAAQYMYAIYKHQAEGANGYTPALTYGQVFYDIVYGDNEMYSNPGSNTPVPSTPVPGYAAGVGYDEVTGVGVPFGGHLIQALTGLTVQ
jgi:subtilase family serine protease